MLKKKMLLLILIRFFFMSNVNFTKDKGAQLKYIGTIQKDTLN